MVSVLEMVDDPGTSESRPGEYTDIKEQLADFLETLVQNYSIGPQYLLVYL